MGASFLITFRDGVEAALIVAIVAAYLRQVGRADGRGPVLLGTVTAIGLSLLAGVVAFTLFDGLEGDARVFVFGAVMAGAVAVLTWMIFWMSRQARHIKGELQHKVDDALRQGSTWALAGVAFFAVLREGIEIVLFLLAASSSGQASAWSRAVGGVLGVVGATGVGYAVYQGGRRINLRLLFRVTGAVVVLFAAGLAARMVAQFQLLGWLHVFPFHKPWYPLWDLSGLYFLHQGNFVGQFVVSLFGWDPTPSIEELFAYLAYLIPVGSLFLRVSRRVRESDLKPPAVASAA